MPTAHRPRTALKLLIAFLVAGPVLLLLCLALVAASFFWVGSEVRVLRNAALESTGTGWDRKVELSFGAATFGLARLAGMVIKDLPAEARAALNAARGGDVSVYEFTGPRPDGAGIVARADQRMLKKGWYRLTGVEHEGNTVAVYVPEKMSNPQKVRACVLVIHENQLVCVSARASLLPLFELGRKHLDQHHLLSKLDPASPN